MFASSSRRGKNRDHRASGSKRVPHRNRPRSRSASTDKVPNSKGACSRSRSGRRRRPVERSENPAAPAVAGIGRSKSDSDKEDKPEDSDDDGPPLPASVADVRSFSEMVRMAPRLQSRASSMRSGELAEVCAASARVKFYDGGLLEAVTSQLQRRLSSKSDNLGIPATVTVLSALADLNAYNRDFFSAAASMLNASLSRLDSELTKNALAAFRAVKHQGAEDLIEALTIKTKSERYEVAKSELFQRQLGKMYGDTIDLQGAPMDAERALLRTPRTSTTRPTR